MVAKPSWLLHPLFCAALWSKARQSKIGLLHAWFCCTVWKFVAPRASPLAKCVRPLHSLVPLPVQSVCWFMLVLLSAIYYSLVITFYLLTELSPSWEAANFAAIQEIPSKFEESEGSLPCLQEPSTGPYPEPVWSSPHHPIRSLQDPF
jgi:hypothetical protein